MKGGQEPSVAFPVRPWLINFCFTENFKWVKRLIWKENISMNFLRRSKYYKVAKAFPKNINYAHWDIQVSQRNLDTYWSLCQKDINIEN